MSSILPINVNAKVMELLECGGFYVQGRDKMFRPLMVIKPAKVFACSPEAEDFIGSILVMMGFVFNNMMLDGHVENLVQI